MKKSPPMSDLLIESLKEHGVEFDMDSIIKKWSSGNKNNYNLYYVIIYIILGLLGLFGLFVVFTSIKNKQLEEEFDEEL